MIERYKIMSVYCNNDFEKYFLSKIPQSPILNRKSAVIAIVGADGSGKSTIGTYILNELKKKCPVRFCHLGKQTGNLGRIIAKLPFFGKKIDKKILEKSSTARLPQGSGSVTAFIIFIFSMRRVLRFIRMRFFHQLGYTILTDRYPQTERPGPMDGPGLICRTPSGTFVKFLTWLEEKIYDKMTEFKPDVVIRLNVDLQTAVTRKPDHRYESLARKISDVPYLAFKGAPVIDLNSNQSLDLVKQQAWKITEHVLSLYRK